MSLKTELNDWKQRLTVSHRHFSTMEQNMKTYKGYYQGDQWQNIERNAKFNDMPVDNIIFSNIRTIVPRLIIRNPRIYASATKKPYFDGKGWYDTVGSAFALEVLLNYYFRYLKTKRETRKCLYDSLLGYWGIMELGFTLETEKVKTGKKGELLEIDELIKSQSVFAKRCSPHDFRVDTEGTDLLLHDRRWVARRWIKSMQDLKDDDSLSSRGVKPNYTVRTDFAASGETAQSAKGELEKIAGDPMLWERVQGWTLWDKKLRKRYNVVETHDKFLSQEPWPKWTDAIEGFPFEMLYINENPDETEPLPDIKIYKSAQDEVNEMGSMVLAHLRKLAVRKFFVKNQGLESTGDEERKLLNGKEEIIYVNGDPNSVVAALRETTSSQDIWLYKRQRKDEINQMAGVPDFERGGVSKFETATEPALLNMGSQTLRDDQQSLFEDFLTRVVSKMAIIIQQTIEKTDVPLNPSQFKQLQRMTRETPKNVNNPLFQSQREFLLSKTAKITGQEGEIFLMPWLTLDKEDIKGQYEYKIEIGSTAPVNSMQRKQDIMQLSEILAGNPYIRMKEATEQILEAFEVKRSSELMKSDEELQAEQESAPPSPEEVKLQERQMKDQTDLMKTQMKTQSAERITQQKTQGSLISDAIKESSK